MTILEELKKRTAERHRSIESVVPLMDRGLTISRYADYLVRVFPFYRAVEAKLHDIDGLREAVDDLDDRWKIRLLAHDLRKLGRLPGQSIGEQFLPRLKTVPEGLGCLYVLEGSTLGGQILLRSVRAKLGEAVEGKTSFLASYGADLAKKWRHLGDALTATLTARSDREAAVRSAQATFSCFHRWLEEAAGTDPYNPAGTKTALRPETFRTQRR